MSELTARDKQLITLQRLKDQDPNYDTVMDSIVNTVSYRIPEDGEPPEYAAELCMEMANLYYINLLRKYIGGHDE